MLIPTKMETKVNIPFQDDRQAMIAYNSLRVEIEPARSKVKRNLCVEGNNLVAHFNAADARSLRVSINSYFEHVALVVDTIKQFGWIIFLQMI